LAALPHQPPTLTTARLVLEARAGRHAPRLFEPLCDPELYRYIPTEPYATVEALRDRYARVARGPARSDERWWNWAVIARNDPARALGTVELSLFGNGARASFAYTFGRASWGVGYATEACAAVLVHLRVALRSCAVQAQVDTCNARSIALLERLGFARTGFIANADYFKARSSDEYVFELALRAETLAVRRARR